MSIKDGGPAFPEALATPTNDGYLSTGGMTLRDYFAARALSNPCTSSHNDPRKVAEWAYSIAHAMLEARDAP